MSNVSNVAPVIIIEFGIRSVLNFIGSAILIMGVWYVDRTWDEKGSAAYKRLENQHNKNNVDFHSSDEIVITIPKEDLDAAFPFPWAFILGWFLCGISHIFKENHVEASVPAILSLFFSILLGIIASAPMGDAVRNRIAKKKKILSLMFFLSWICLAIFTSFKENTFMLRNRGLPLVFCLVGALTVVTSMKILWKHRKMGNSWERQGKPNRKPVVYNMGGPLFIIGFVFFWIGMAQKDHPDGQGYFVRDCRNEACGLPIFLNVRTLLAWLAGCGMVPVVMLVDCAHDNGNDYIGFPYGTNGKSFGKFLESPALFLTHWTLFGLSGFLNTNNEFAHYHYPRVWIVFVLCVLQGITAGIFIQTALYEGNIIKKNIFSVPFVLIFIAIAISIGFSPAYEGLNAHGFAMGLCILGMLFVVVGQKAVFGDRIRGDYWMQNKVPNPNPIVYSVGEPLFMFGWILVSWGMSYAY